MENYDQLRKEAWDLYSKLEPVCCPTLNNELVVFSRAGFNHFLQKRGTPRPQEDQLRRFKLLPHATSIIENSTSSITTRNEPGATFWKITNQVGNKIIHVLIRQKEMGPKHFFSIMSN